MKALILTGSFGMGHNSCADAVAKQLTASFNNIEIVKIDIWNYILHSFDKLVYSSFNLLANRYFSLYNSLKIVAENQSRFPFEDIVSRKMHKLMQLHRPDFVISTLSTSSTIMSNYKGRYNDKTPFITCITDIRIHKDWVGEHIDYYCVGAPELRQTLVSMGVNPEKIYVTGIPVSPIFTPADNVSSTSSPTKILVMGGGLGLLPESNLILPLLNGDKNLEVTLITGKNKALYKKATASYPNIKTIGYTDNVATYMRNSHVLISKPGGVTMFEAINSALPMLVIKPFLAQELANADFIEGCSIGHVVRGDARAYTELCAMLSDKHTLSHMRQNMLELRAATNPDTLCRLVAGILKKRVVA